MKMVFPDMMMMLQWYHFANNDASLCQSYDYGDDEIVLTREGLPIFFEGTTTHPAIFVFTQFVLQLQQMLSIPTLLDTDQIVSIAVVLI